MLHAPFGIPPYLRVHDMMAASGGPLPPLFPGRASGRAEARESDAVGAACLADSAELPDTHSPSYVCADLSPDTKGEGKAWAAKGR